MNEKCRNCGNDTYELNFTIEENEVTVDAFLSLCKITKPKLKKVNIIKLIAKCSKCGLVKEINNYPCIIGKSVFRF